MPTSGDDATGDSSITDGTTGDTGGRGVDGVAEEDAAETALSAAIDDTDGQPTCALCSKAADYFLYETDHVEKFVCWEHVSPHSAAVDGEDARPGRPLALSL